MLFIANVLPLGEGNNNDFGRGIHLIVQQREISYGDVQMQKIKVTF